MRWPDAWHVSFIVVFAAIDAVAHIAAVRMVVEDRRSAIGAWVAALRFVVRRPARVGGLYLVNWLIGLALFSAWFRLVPPGADVVRARPRRRDGGDGGPRDRAPRVAVIGDRVVPGVAGPRRLHRLAAGGVARVRVC